MSKARVHGLYALTGAAPPAPGGQLLEQVRRAILGGARVIQYRDKGSGSGRRTEEARALCELCRAHGVPLIVNDDVALAEAIGAAGVHLGRDDLAVAAARRRLGPDAIIGASCYNEFERAVGAQAQGADYAAFGSFFCSPTKPAAARAAAELLRRAKRRLGIAVVAIGGITPENGAPLIAAGADALAAASGIFGQPDPAAAARRYAQLFAPPAVAARDRASAGGVR